MIRYVNFVSVREELSLVFRLGTLKYCTVNDMIIAL